MKISTEQIKKDIDFLSVFLDDNEQINEVIDACETLGIGSAEYFFEEFDAKKIATKLVRSHPKYSNHTVESLMRKWTETADYGTRVHSEIEQWFKKQKFKPRK